MSSLSTRLDANQVLRNAYDDDEKALRVLAQVTATIGELDVTIDASAGDNIAIADPTGTNFLLPNVDGSINVNINDINIDAATDSIAIGDGTDLLAVNSDGSINVKDADNLAALNAINVTLSGTVTVSDVGVVNAVNDVLDFMTNGVQNSLMTGTEDSTVLGASHVARIDSDLDLRVGISNGVNKAEVSPSGELSVSDDQSQVILSDILSQLQSTGGLSVGTEDGTLTGTSHVFINNLRLLITKAHDVVSVLTYLDPTSKKNRREDKIEYTSATFPGFKAVLQFGYTLIGTDYVITNPGTWSIVVIP